MANAQVQQTDTQFVDAKVAELLELFDQLSENHGDLGSKVDNAIRAIQEIQQNNPTMTGYYGTGVKAQIRAAVQPLAQLKDMPREPSGLQSVPLVNLVFKPRPYTWPALLEFK